MRRNDESNIRLVNQLSLIATRLIPALAEGTG